MNLLKADAEIATHEIPKADDWPLIVILLTAAAILSLIGSAWDVLVGFTTSDPGRGVGLGLAGCGASMLLFAIASGLRSLYQIEYHLRGRYRNEMSEMSDAPVMIAAVVTIACLCVLAIVFGVASDMRRTVSPPPMAPAELTDQQKAAESCRMLRHLWNGKSESEIPRNELGLLNRCDSLGL